MSSGPPPPTPASILEAGRNCWRIVRAHRAALIIDAADYFRIARQAILNARTQIMLIGWDVDTRIRLVSDEDAGGAPAHLGALLSFVAKKRPELRIHILAWDEGLISVPGRGTTFFRMLNWWQDPRITVKWDSTHPLDASHHQKILVIDDALAFCGGIDMTGQRWDTRHHRDDEPGRKAPFTRRVYEPWHDATMAVDGGAARALGELARKRWNAATWNDKLVPPREGADPWPDELKPAFQDVCVGIARTRGHEGPWKEIREIEALFLDLIRCAERYVYIETQYFSSRVIAEAVAKRLEEPDGPEFVIINPKTGEGWLDETVMGPARYLLLDEVRKRDRHGRFRIYSPVTEQGMDIYVHAKVMIVDDTYFRVGSANINNRSMGLDSECDILIDGSDEREDVRRKIAELRCDFVAEHLGRTCQEVMDHLKKTGSLIATIEQLRGQGRTLVPLNPEKPADVALELANSQLLDPEAPDELFDPKARPGLLSRFKTGRRR